MKRIYVFAAALIMSAGFLPHDASAATFTGGRTYNLPSSGVVEDNLYVGASDVTMGGRVRGDLLVAGGTIVMSGIVRDDLAAAGGNLSVLGAVGGDVRVAGGNILIDAPVGGDLMAAGGTVKVLQSVTAGKSVNLAGGYVVFDGTSNGDAQFAGGEVIINGVIKGNVLVAAGKKLTLGDTAHIDGVLVYRSADENVLEKSATAVVTGGVRFEKVEQPVANSENAARGFAAFLGAVFVFKLITASVVALILVLVFRRFSEAVVATATAAYWANVLRGFVTLVIVPIVAIILLATIIGSLAGLVLLLMYGFLLIVSGIYSGVVFGSMLMKRVGGGQDRPLMWWHALLGVIVLALIGIIPVIGWIVGLVFFLNALGTIVRLLRTSVWDKR
jgi:hypothetical protein